jgi:hypothetical protein
MQTQRLFGWVKGPVGGLVGAPLNEARLKVRTAAGKLTVRGSLREGLFQAGRGTPGCASTRAALTGQAGLERACGQHAAHVASTGLDLTQHGGQAAGVGAVRAWASGRRQLVVLA